ncbi:MAG TPA: hypothetical protein VEW68_05430 [Patescibacteria group bacterium]|nr:hypothetical protein [Patescibacteria group bacterium]
MAPPKIKSVRLLSNHGAVVIFTGTRGTRRRFERPDGFLTCHEAAVLLETYPNMIRRMDRAGLIRLGPSGNRRRVPLSELRRLMRLPRSLRASADKGAALGFEG